MKTRDGFVSNSSSSSFVIKAKGLVLCEALTVLGDQAAADYIRNTFLGGSYIPEWEEDDLFDLSGEYYTDSRTVPEVYLDLFSAYLRSRGATCTF